ncbi:MAG: DNA cytosine methyltransferase [Acidobacteria bacterium]|nr:DNA cytosine methyltransferase [Acidobacteriota bacterium]
METKQRTIKAADLYCGAGGTSRGLRLACERMGHDLRLTAINHWPKAIETHSANEPAARHICERLDRVDPRHVVPDGHLDLLIASPECTHHSRARGGRPSTEQQRASAWMILRWAEALYVDSILIENVPEFTTWGPLDRHGLPIKARAGETYQAFLTALRSLGYHVDDRVLNAADYGDPTTRRRVFILAQRRQRPRWPEATHQPRTEAGQTLPPWRGAREIIDWSIKGKSIFTRRKPLAPATLQRIETGLRRFGGPTAEPFIVILRNHAAARPLDQPVPTITGSGTHLGLCEPFLLGQQSGAVARPVREPAPTVATGGAISLIEPFIFANRTHAAPKRLDSPMPTLCTGHHMVLIDTAARATVRPGPTGDPDTPWRPVIRLDGALHELDIRFRMLMPHELAQAQGFGRHHRFCGTKTEQIRQIGNAVPVGTAQALCSALLA